MVHMHVLVDGFDVHIRFVHRNRRNMVHLFAGSLPLKEVPAPERLPRKDERGLRSESTKKHRIPVVNIKQKVCIQ